MKFARLPRLVSKSKEASLLFFGPSLVALEHQGAQVYTFGHDGPLLRLSDPDWLCSRSRRRLARGHRSGLSGSTSTPGHRELYASIAASSDREPTRGH